MAVTVATITRLEIAVVALLLTIEDAIPAVLNEVAQLTWLRASITEFYLARARAAISRSGVAVIAGLVGLQFPVAAYGRADADDARFARSWTRIARVHTHAVFCAPIATHCTAIIANLIARDQTIAAHNGRHAWLAWRGARVIGFQTTYTRAAIAGKGVSVIAGLARLEDAVATDRSDRACATANGTSPTGAAKVDSRATGRARVCSSTANTNGSAAVRDAAASQKKE
jgi:hypothetical protein